MMDWTDRHCRHFHRLITRRARLYTEMVTTGALLHGDVRRHLDFGEVEHPLALQLGGSEADELAACARLAAAWGYDEVNLNCGCPSERVQRGAFGACLMSEAVLVRDCVAAMREAVGGALPVTVKHRIGVDRVERYEYVRDFVATVAEGGCATFIVHARNAWLQGLSPKDNREIPPLRYDIVHRLKREFPQLTIAINGGFADNASIAEQLHAVDGVMVGRQAYHDPCLMASWDRRFLGEGAHDDPAAAGLSGAGSKAHEVAFAASGEGWKADAVAAAASRDGPQGDTVAAAASRELWKNDARAAGRSGDDAEDPGDDWRTRIEDEMVGYLSRLDDVPWPHAARHMLGLWHGRPGARRWRQVWSDHRVKALPPAEVQRRARAAREHAAAEARHDAGFAHCN
jgi:tRNA-dihydrouridine synthase A